MLRIIDISWSELNGYWYHLTNLMTGRRLPHSDEIQNRGGGDQIQLFSSRNIYKQHTLNTYSHKAQLASKQQERLEPMGSAW